MKNPNKSPDRSQQTPPLYDVIEEVQALTASTPGSALVLTPNRRLATRLRLTDDLMKADDRTRSSNGGVWRTLTVEPWEQWIASLWEAWQLRHWWRADAVEGEVDLASSMDQLLTPQQEPFLWEQVIRASHAGDRLLRPAATARLVQEAEKWVDHYQLEIDDAAQRENEDVQQFCQWSNSFRKRCKEGGWLSAGKVLLRLSDLDLAPLIAPYSSVLLYGFRYFSPSEKRFLALLETRYQLNVHRVEPKRAAAPVRLAAQRDRTSEYQAAIAWAWSLASQERGQGAFAPRIGIVVPHLEQDRALIQRLFIRHGWPEQMRAAARPLHADEEHADEQQRDNPSETASDQGEGDKSEQEAHPEFILGRWVNISGGIPIWQTPILHIALELLALLKSPLLLVSLCRLLRSPFLGGAEREAFTRQQLERQLRKRQIERFGWSALLDWIQREPRPAPDFMQRVEQAQAFVNSDKYAIKQSHTLDRWLRIFQQWLALWGWPGERTLSSSEYQMHSKWFESVEHFLALQRVSDRSEHDALSQYTLPQALTLLRQSGEGMTYQAQSDEAPIQVLGLLEADGQQFDHLWVTGLEADRWPQAVRPNPFLPATLQREKQLPHASPERELALARDILSDFQRATDHALVLSWSQQEEDRILLPSPVLRQFSEAQEAPTPSHQSYSDPLLTLAGCAERIHFSEQSGPPLPVGKRVTGGTHIIRDQGACPFKAFVRYRLQAKEVESPRIGLSPAERGDAVHFALQHFWRETRSQDDLNNLSAEALELLIAESASVAMEGLLGERQKSFSTHFLELESQRLVQLTTAWLQHEKARAPFNVVAVEEGQIEVIDDFEMRLRIDRIDQVGENQFLIIDYKTGRAKVAQWLDEALEEPQLPLYCITSSYEVCGIAFGEVKADRSRLSALVRDELQLFNTRVRHVTAADDWSAITAQWRAIISERISAFRQGWAAVDPRDRANTCRYCPYPTLCRIEEREQGA